MKRFHVHVSVSDLQQSIRFYSSLFGVQPSKVEADYAKWMLDDPRINFAISQRGGEVGINHLGVQVDSDHELRGMKQQLQDADAGMVEQTGTACCYSRSDKYWVSDPSGVAWETFHSLGDVPRFTEHPDSTSTGCCIPIHQKSKDETACCVPAKDATSSCCE